ncbi:hypothetical protein [Eubacterium ramulus]
MKLIDADMMIKNIHERSYISNALSEIFETIIDEQPTAFDFEDVLKQLEEEARLSEEEKSKVNSLRYDRVIGYLNGILNAKLIVESALTLVKSEYGESEDCDEIVQQIEQLRMQYFLTIANTGDKALDVAYEKVYQALESAMEIVKRGAKYDK